MKISKYFMPCLILSLLTGCIMMQHRNAIREGLLVTSLNREAFLKEWGVPDKTYTISSDEFTEIAAGWGHRYGSGSGSGGGSFGYFKGKVPLDVWVYGKSSEVTLVFYKLRLINWKTDKSTQELKALSRGTGK